MKTSIVMALFAAIALGAGCGPTEVRGDAYYEAPSLEYVSPGVQVVADDDYPVFFSDDLYWRYDGGVWYQSHVYNGGWRRAEHVPGGVAHIDRPSAYVHYHARVGGAARVANHAGPAPAAAPARATPVPRASHIPPPRVRDSHEPHVVAHKPRH